MCDSDSSIGTDKIENSNVMGNLARPEMIDLVHEPASWAGGLSNQSGTSSNVSNVITTVTSSERYGEIKGYQSHTVTM